MIELFAVAGVAAILAIVFGGLANFTATSDERFAAQFGFNDRHATWTISMVFSLLMLICIVVGFLALMAALIAWGFA